MKEIYDNIRSIRILKNLSQEHVAEGLGISQSSYGKLERGTTRVTWDKLVRIATILHTTPWEIVNFNKSRPFPLSETNEESDPSLGANFSSHQNVEILQERVKYLEQVNELLKKQLDDKTEIIQLLKKELGE